MKYKKHKARCCSIFSARVLFRHKADHELLLELATS